MRDIILDCGETGTGVGVTSEVIVRDCDHERYYTGLW